MLTIGKIAKASGVGVETVRFYERKGLIQKPKKKASEGFHKYKEEDAVRIRFIKRTQELGFTLKEIKELFSLNVGPKATCEKVRSHAELKRIEVEKKLDDLKRIQRALLNLEESCASGKKSASCRQMMDCFEGECC